MMPLAIFYSIKDRILQISIARVKIVKYNHYLCHMTAPLIGVERHRISTDGRGVTTLVAFHGCPLHCKYCLNPQCHDATGHCRVITPQRLLEEVSVDNLYFIATDGGVTFGGGEPLLKSDFIHEFCSIAPQEWNISVETSLNVNRQHLEEIMPHTDHYFIDIKDMNPHIYKNYTASNNEKVNDNLRLLAANVPPEHITIRLPIIPGFNNEKNRKTSMEILRKMGFVNFDLFKYIIRKNENTQDNE